MISGNYCKSFQEATHAMLDGVSLNAPYKFHWLKVVRVEGNTVHCTGAGEPMQFRIKRKRGKGGPLPNYIDVTVADPIFGSLLFRAYPFKGEET